MDATSIRHQQVAIELTESLPGSRALIARRAIRNYLDAVEREVPNLPYLRRSRQELEAIGLHPQVVRKYARRR